jgi:CRP-like cAMP-binding protein
VTTTTSSAVPWGNRLLAALPPDERARLEGRLRLVRLEQDTTILTSGDEVTQAYFPLDGVVALLMVLENGMTIEVATIGNEGFATFQALLSAGHSPYEVTCQTPVEALQLGVDDLRAAFRDSEPLRDLLMRYGAVLFGCTGRSLACARLHTTEQRMARWLLMTRDRVAGDELPLTQDALARALGVHRPTASLAAEALRERGAIDYRRGRIRVTDRGALEAASCDDYHAYREAYEALLGRIPPAGGPARTEPGFG